jgi:hypothetical protein
VMPCAAVSKHGHRAAVVPKDDRLRNARRRCAQSERRRGAAR